LRNVPLAEAIPVSLALLVAENSVKQHKAAARQAKLSAGKDVRNSY
jgi:hypothetical protein